MENELWGMEVITDSKGIPIGAEKRYIVKGTLYRAEIPFAVGGLLVQDGIVIETAPIFKWAKGKELSVVQNWINSKGGTVHECV